jgi:hypothetical protein
MPVEWRPATSEAKAQVAWDGLIAALKRCATQDPESEPTDSPSI